jgi:hypothetical protein
MGDLKKNQRNSSGPNRSGSIETSWTLWFQP